MKGFASDNISGVHPDIMKAMMDVNTDHTPPYGEDIYTQRAEQKFCDVFGPGTTVFFTFNGTAANVLSLASVTSSFQAVICSDCAHINVDECGAPEKFIGCKLFALPSSDGGKITVPQMEPLLHHIGFEHHNQPAVISITQPTELGEIYTCEEIRVISDFAKNNKMTLHMDGARISNAAAAMDKDLKAITRDMGVDILSFGGTKNGAMFGEAVVFFNPEMARHAKYIRKQSMQLGSKMRFIAAQFEALLSNELWLENAQHANRMARFLYDRIKDIPCVDIQGKVQTNAVFAIIPPGIVSRLQQETFFYTWDATLSKVRLMTSFDTTQDDILAFETLIRAQSG